MPGTGPYRIQTYVPGRLLTFERNRYFKVWSAAARPDGFPDEIAYRVVTDQDTATRSLLAGQGDVVTASHETPLLNQFIAQHPLRVHVDAEQATVFVFLNVRRPPFNDLRVRRALNYAVDRAHVVALAGTAFARPTCQLVPPMVSGYQAYCPYTIAPDATGQWKAPDLSQAKSLIKASGTNGQPIVVWAFSDYVSEARYIVALLNHLGYRASLHYVPNDATYFAELAKAPAAQAGLFGWFGAALAVDALGVIGCEFDPNPAHFCDRGVDVQLRRLAHDEPADPAGTAGRAATLDRRITDNAPWVPLFTPTYTDLTSPRVGNYQAQGGQALLDQLWVR